MDYQKLRNVEERLREKYEKELENALKTYNERLDEQKSEQEFMFSEEKKRHEENVIRIKEECEKEKEQIREEYTNIVMKNLSRFKKLEEKMSEKIEELENQIKDEKWNKPVKPKLDLTIIEKPKTNKLRERLEESELKNNELTRELENVKMEVTQQIEAKQKVYERMRKSLINNYENKQLQQEEEYESRIKSLESKLEEERKNRNVAIGKHKDAMKEVYERDIEENEKKMNTDFFVKIDQQKKENQKRMEEIQEKCHRVLKSKIEEIQICVVEKLETLTLEYDEEFLEWMKERQNKRNQELSQLKNKFENISRNSGNEIRSIFL